MQHTHVSNETLSDTVNLEDSTHTHPPLVEHQDPVDDLDLDHVIDPLVEGDEADAGQDVQQNHRHHHRQ